MAETYYKQCTLTNQANMQTQIAWIPEKFAELGRRLILGKREPGAPQWQVMMVSDMRLEGSYLADHERDYKTQRQASDI